MKAYPIFLAIYHEGHRKSSFKGRLNYCDFYYEIKDYPTFLAIYHEGHRKFSFMGRLNYCDFYTIDGRVTHRFNGWQ